jgi:hypothetical protein
MERRIYIRQSGYRLKLLHDFSFVSSSPGA